MSRSLVSRIRLHHRIYSNSMQPRPRAVLSRHIGTTSRNSSRSTSLRSSVSGRRSSTRSAAKTSPSSRRKRRTRRPRRTRSHSADSPCSRAIPPRSRPWRTLRCLHRSLRRTVAVRHLLGMSRGKAAWARTRGKCSGSSGLWGASGRQRLFAMLRSSRLTSRNGRRSRRRTRPLTPSHPRAMLTETDEQRRGAMGIFLLRLSTPMLTLPRVYRIEEEIARMKKNQERRLHRKNAKIVKEGGTPLQLNRPIKPDTTVSSVRPPLSMPMCTYALAFPASLRALRPDGTHE